MAIHIRLKTVGQGFAKSSISNSCIAGQALFIPLISLMGISEALVLVFLYLTFMARYLIKAFATKSWMYYLGNLYHLLLGKSKILIVCWTGLLSLGGLIDPLSSYSFSVIKAMSTMCVSSSELGKINAVLSALESLFPLVAVQGYTSLWKVSN